MWQRGRAEGRGLGIESRGLVGVKGKVSQSKRYGAGLRDMGQGIESRWPIEVKGRMRGRWCRWQGWRKGDRDRARRQKGAGREQGERLGQGGRA